METSNRAVRRSSPFLAPFNVKMSLSRASSLLVCLVMRSGSGHNLLELLLPDAKLHLGKDNLLILPLCLSSFLLSRQSRPKEAVLSLNSSGAKNQTKLVQRTEGRLEQFTAAAGIEARSSSAPEWTR